MEGTATEKASRPLQSPPAPPPLPSPYRPKLFVGWRQRRPSHSATLPPPLPPPMPSPYRPKLFAGWRQRRPSHLATLPPPPPPPPPPTPYRPRTFAAGRGPRAISTALALLMWRTKTETSSPPEKKHLRPAVAGPVEVPYSFSSSNMLKRKPSSRVEPLSRPQSQPARKRRREPQLQQRRHGQGLRRQKQLETEHEFDLSAVVLPPTEEGGGGGGAGADGAVISPDESLRQEIRIDIDSCVPRGGAGDELRSRWICRVHPSIREKQVQAYEPKLVSIGPLHHGKPSLQPMEATKKRYVRTLLARSPAESNTLEGYIVAIRGIEDRARKAYPAEHEVVQLMSKSDAFAKMLLVDGCFVIEYMLREFFGEKQDEGVWGSLHNLERDLILLENQIPFFVLQELFHRTRCCSLSSTSSPPTSFVQIALHFLGVEADHSMGIVMKKAADDAHHLLHLSHLCWQRHGVLLVAATSSYSRARHAVVAVLSYPIRVALRLIKQAVICVLFVLLINEWPWSRHEPDLLKKIPCAADLDMSGVKFRRKVLRRSSSSMEHYLEEQYYSASCNISFRRREGVLEIPFVAVGQTLNARLRNFIALEQCRRDDLPCHYSAYVSFMNSIIYTPADVAVLRKYGVIEISFGSDEDVAKMFKSIYEDTNLYKVEIKEITQLSKQVNEYRDVAYHRWRGRLRSSYLRSPWSAVALFVASIVLGLTVTQTIFTIRQSYT